MTVIRITSRIDGKTRSALLQDITDAEHEANAQAFEARAAREPDNADELLAIAAKIRREKTS